jgi:TatD DNase family protein
MTKYSVAYEYNGAMYLNITNRCPNLCSFCIKNKWNMMYRGYNLKLEKEPDIYEVLDNVKSMFDKKDFKEIVFCGYGEPTMRWDLIKEFSSIVRKGEIKNVDPCKRIRINTNGLGNLINKRDITVEMKGLINSLHISLNTSDPNQWIKIMRPFKGYENGFETVVDFIIKAKESVDEVVITAVELKEVDIKAVEDFSLKLGVKFRKRPILDYEEV